MIRRPRPRRHGSRHACAVSLCLSCCLSCGGADEAATDDGEELPGGDTTNDIMFGVNAFLPPASNVSRENARLFATGNAYFNQAWTVSPSSNESRDGLGPLFNARSCSACHFKDGRGRPPLEPDEAFTSMLLRLSVPGVSETGEALPEPRYGGQLQPFSVDGVPSEGAPRVEYRSIAGTYADGEPYELLEPAYHIDELSQGAMHSETMLSPRVAPAMIGLGLLEAISAERLLELADPEDADGDGISGRVNRVWDAALGGQSIGRFGWKAEQPSVRQQAAGAFLGDMGITSSLFPSQDCTEVEVECHAAIGGGDPELTDELLQRIERYSQLVAVPARFDFADADVLRGKAHFAALGCDGCHTPSHRTLPDAELAEVRDQLIWPYTDLLLHDLGDGLSDRRPSFDAEGNEWRTPPLWGLGHYPDVNGHDRLLHDGRARGVAEAILWHGGEAAASRDAFVELSADGRRDLVRFVESL